MRVRLKAALAIAGLALLSLTIPWAVVLQAAAWTGVLDTARATDWSEAGIQGGIPSGSWANCVTSACNTLWNGGAAGAVTTANLNSAISSAANSDTVVRIPVGTHTGLGTIVMSSSRMAVRGQGGTSTKLVFSSSTGMCGWIQDSAFKFCAGTGNIACTTTCSGPGPDNSATWSGTLTQGTSSITISTGVNLVARSGAVPGTTIFLDQIDDDGSGNDIIVCDDGTDVNCSWEGNDGNPHRTNRSYAEPHEVISCSPACGTASTSTVVIDPPVIAAHFASGQTPGAWWGSAGNHVKLAGVEDLTIDYSALGSNVSAVYAVNCTHCWAKGVRAIWTGTDAGFLFPIYVTNTFRFVLRDSYIYGPTLSPPDANTNYAVSALVSGSNLYENNILHHIITGFASDDVEAGSVYSYNLVDDQQYSPGVQPHGSADMYNLFEGNNVDSLWSDNIHGPHYFNTWFRNHVDRTARNDGSVAENGCFLVYSHNRFFNIVGNVCGHSSLTAYGNTTGSGEPVYILDYAGSHSGTGPANDTNVTRTIMRWGNWDSITSTNDTGTNDATGTRFVSGEVPSGIANYANAVPGAQTLPASFYLTACPSTWWVTAYGTPAWPAIGPDVSDGNTNTSTAPTGGHANKIPARLAFENTVNDPAYPSSSPRILSFDRATAYPGGSCGAGPGGSSTIGSLLRRFR